MALSTLCGASRDSWTFRYFASSPSGRFTTTLDDSLPGRFTTWTFCTFGCFDTRTFRYLPGRFATCLKVCNLQYCKNFFVVWWRNAHGASETFWYRNIQRCETSRWQNVQVVKCPGSETSKWRTGNVAKRPVSQARLDDDNTHKMCSAQGA